MMSTTRLLINTLIFFWLTACDTGPEQTRANIDMPAAKMSQTTATASAETTLKRFIDASISRRHADYYDLLSGKDQAIKTREQYLEEQQKLQPNLADAYFQAITYQITAITLNGSEAKAEVNYQYPDVEHMIKQVFNLSILDSSALPALDEMKQKIDTAFKNKPLPMKTITRHFTLLQENADWRVYIAWDKQR